MPHSFNRRQQALLAGLLTAAALLSACAIAPPQPPACDDGLKAAFQPDGLTRVIAVRAVKKGEAITVPDAPTPITTVADMCLVKLLVGPGATAEKDKNARSYSEGIGIEVWLPTHANWNERIRNYGGGGFVGGGHRYADQVGSKAPAIINANMGYASGTTDAGQPWYQDGSFVFLSNGQFNTESYKDFSSRAMLEQALKTQALVAAYYGKQPKFKYYDGHSQGGRQGLKVMQEWPDLYDGYLIGQPAISVPQFGTNGAYVQLVLKTELGFTALDKDKAAAFAKKVEAANRRAVAHCDKPGLGFLLDPFACDYDAAKDAQVLCAGVAGLGVTGTSADAASCMNLAEAHALNRIWYGATADGSWNPNASIDERSGRRLGAKQTWWNFPMGSGISGQITRANADNVAIAAKDIRYAASADVAGGVPLQNAAVKERNKWQELNYGSLALLAQQSMAQQASHYDHFATDKVDLRRLRELSRKVIVHSGLAEDAIPPQGNVYWHERVLAAMGGDAEVRKFMRMYLLPGAAHSSQGRAYTVGGQNNRVPLAQLPGNANQNPTREQDQFFSALVDWVEQGRAPESLVITSRDKSLSYPICVYPQRTTWVGSGSAKELKDFVCR